MSRLARPALPSDENGKLSHARVWSAIDALAARYGMSPSGLAKRAGLDATTFNRSKRQTNDGRLRWPSTESIAKVLDATGASLSEFLGLSEAGAPPNRLTLPLIGLSQIGGASELFDASGFPASAGWDEVAFPNLSDEHAYAVEIAGDALLPTYRDGDVLIVSPAAPLRRGDRILTRTVDGETTIGELRRRTAKTVELRTLDAAAAERALEAEHIAWIARIVWSSQ
jgi:phage repressor protein C with HTH and peptisase S24 domain